LAASLEYELTKARIEVVRASLGLAYASLA
jgi:hypothetical protein